MDGQALQILEDGVIDRACRRTERHYDAIDYYQKRIDKAQDGLFWQKKLWGWLKREWDDYCDPETEFCKEMIRQNIEAIDKIEEEAQKRIDYIYRDEDEPSQTDNGFTLEA